MLDIRTGRQMTRRDFGRGLASILAAGVAPSVALGLAGSANASVGGLRRGKAAMIGLINGGKTMKTITYDGGTITTCGQFRNWAVEKLGSHRYFLIAKQLVDPLAYNQIYGGYLNVTTQCMRWRGNLNGTAIWANSYDGFCSVGDVFYAIEIPEALA